jgi:uncharacterized OsmC-like protein
MGPALNPHQQKTKIMKTPSSNPGIVNGIDTGALKQAIETIGADPAMGQTRWQVASHWRGGTRSDTRVTQYHIGGEKIDKDFTIQIDEPLELCGSNRFPNPQEYLMAALNACMMVGFTALCALEGIELEELRIDTEGDIDLRGFLGLDANVRPGYDQLRQTLVVRGNGTPEQFERIHAMVMKTSPNYFNLTTSIPVNGRLMVETSAKSATKAA